MFNISNFLDKTIKKLNNNSERKKKIISSIKEIINIEINEEAIETNEGIIVINTSQSIKNKLFINKRNILKSLESENYIDIR